MTLHPFAHAPVLAQEIAAHSNCRPGDFAVDCTGGGGGHTQILLDQVGSTGKVLTLDQDPRAIAHLNQRFAGAVAGGNLHIHHCAFANIANVLTELGGQGSVKFLLADLGVSSPQIDDATRGFSFQKNGPLDMRMNTSQNQTAADIVNNVSERELSEMIYQYGEDRAARKIARAIIKARERQPITTTEELARIIQSTLPVSRKHSGKHPATQTFQALRIVVNKELEQLTQLLYTSFAYLVNGGRMGIITFHSLEDRLVKQTMQEWSGKKQTTDEFSRNLPFPLAPTVARASIVKPFPVIPSPEETSANIRARSAKLRVCEKIS